MRTETSSYRTSRDSYSTTPRLFVRPYFVRKAGDATDYAFSRDFASGDVLAPTVTKLKCLSRVQGNNQRIDPVSLQSTIGLLTAYLNDRDGEITRYVADPARILMTALEGATAAWAFLTDSGIHTPPTAGLFPLYNTFGTFGPDQLGFPALGATYRDPIFDSVIRRLTNELSQQSNAEIYSKNGFFNSDNTVMHHRAPGGAATHHFINPNTGAVVRTPVTFNFDSSFSPVDPDLWYYFDNTGVSAELKEFSVDTGLGTTIKTFPGNLGSLGGSVDFIDRTGRYFVLHVGANYRVWDKQTDTLYTGNIPDSTYGDGWVGISPDGNYVITSTTGSPALKHSFAINHGTQTVNTTPVLFWTLNGDHADIISATDSKTYLIAYDSWDTGDVYRVDVTLAQTHADRPKQRSDNVLLFPLDIAHDDAHFSCGAKGAFQDWVFVSSEAGDDSFGDSITGWRAFMQEIVMVNVLTGDIRRIAHHRSRSTLSDYYYQPKVNASWDGGIVAWQSNFGFQATGYADLYAINTNPGALVPQTSGFFTPALWFEGETTGTFSYIEVDDASGYPSAGHVTIDNEDISYLAKDLTTTPHRLTGVTRAQRGTLAAAHAAGAVVRNGEQLRRGARLTLFTGYEELAEPDYGPGPGYTKMEITKLKFDSRTLIWEIEASDIQRLLKKSIFDAATSDAPTIIGGEGVHPLTILLQVLLSTGDATNGPYDVLDEDTGAGIPEALIDVAAIARVRDSETPDFQMQFREVEPQEVLQWIESQILQPLNCAIAITQEGKLSIKRFGTPEFRNTAISMTDLVVATG